MVSDRPARAPDEIEQFGILELVQSPGTAGGASAALAVDGQEFPASIDPATGAALFRFMLKDARRWSYRIERPGGRVDLSAEGSSDPDGDALSYEWFYYNEAGTSPASSARSGQPVEIHASRGTDA